MQKDDLSGESDQPSKQEKRIMGMGVVVGIICGSVAWLLTTDPKAIAAHDRFTIIDAAIEWSLLGLGAMLGSLGFVAKPRRFYAMSGLLYIYFATREHSPMELSFVVSWWAAFLTVIMFPISKKFQPDLRGS